jgi:signal transduction histidine kinase
MTEPTATPDTAGEQVGLATDVAAPTRTASQAVCMPGAGRTARAGADHVAAARRNHPGAVCRHLSLESTRPLVAQDPDRVEERLSEAVESLDEIARALRNHGFRPRPDDSAGMGLTRGLAELAREHEVTALHHPSLSLNADLDARVPAALVPTLLAIVREALADCAAHADASGVEIATELNGGAVTLWLRDDGASFSPDTPPVGRGLDLIRDRAAAVHGYLETPSTPAAGTLGRITVPADDTNSPCLATGGPASPPRADPAAGCP